MKVGGAGDGTNVLMRGGSAASTQIALSFPCSLPTLLATPGPARRPPTNRKQLLWSWTSQAPELWKKTSLVPVGLQDVEKSSWPWAGSGLPVGWCLYCEVVMWSGGGYKCLVMFFSCAPCELQHWPARKNKADSITKTVAYLLWG